MEEKRICEVHLQIPSLKRAQLEEFMVRHHGYQVVDHLGQSSMWLQVQSDVHVGKSKRVEDAKFPQFEGLVMSYRGGGLLMLQCFLKKHWSLGMLLASWKIN